jgi:tRNA pseudouridine synthase 10
VDADRVSDEIVAAVLARVASDGIALATFHVGLVFEDATMAREGWLDDFRSRVKRRAGKLLHERWQGERTVDLARPDAVFVWDVRKKTLEVRLRALHVYGRYVKLARGLSQTRWHCRSCGGRGCKKCRGGGLVFEESVEELIGRPIAAAFGALRPPILHGMGREDQDVRMLGAGRPFVLEVDQPRRRHVDLAVVARTVDESAPGKVALAGPLRLVDAAVVARVKTLDPPKKYRALARAAAPLDPARVATLVARIVGVALSQKTPRRVLTGRGDIVRPRRVLELEVVRVGESELELILLTEAGTYVKEVVSGDEGRTTPSMAEILGVPIAVVELDVLEVRSTDEEVLS